MDIGTPRTAAYDMDAQELILDQDADTSITSDTDDLIDFKAAGQDVFKIDATGSSPVNGLTVLASATGVATQLKAHGSDTNIGVTVVPKGSGQFGVTATTILLDAVTSVDIDGSALILDADGDSSLRETSDDVLALKLQNVDAFIFDGDVASPVNGYTFKSSATTVDPTIEAQGSDSVINTRLVPKSTGVAVCAGGWAVDGATNLTWRWQGSGTSLLLQENTGSASSPTWTTRNTLATGVGIGGLVPLQTYSPSAAASVDITSIISASYSTYLIKFALVPATDGADLWIRTDANNGASFDSGASDYGYHGVNNTGTTTVTGAGSDAAAQILVTTTGVDDALGSAGSIWIDTLGSGTRYPQLTFSVSYMDDNGTAHVWRNGGGSRLTAAAINAVQLLFSSGNIASGTVRIYGL